MSELQKKIAVIRETLQREGLGAVRLRGVDWFSWATCGASSVVILTAESGIADVVVNRENVWIVTNRIEEGRLRDEEALDAFSWWSHPWQEPERSDVFVRDVAAGLPVASDRPHGAEVSLPVGLLAAKRRLVPEEVERYRKLGRDAASAMTATLQEAQPSWTEEDLAGKGAQAMWARGIHPTLTLVAGSERLGKYRHPLPTGAPLGDRAMLVFCARRHGLYANLTRFVYFRGPSEQETRLLHAVARIESVAWTHSRPGAELSRTYEAIAEAYRQEGFAEEVDLHHQGGTTGYLSREVVATAKTRVLVEPRTAFAWNPSLVATKIEDTVVSTEEGVEIVTVDEQWPTFEIDGRKRPDFLVRAEGGRR